MQVRDNDGLPRQRIEMVEHEERRVRPPAPEQADRPGLFSGDEAGEARAASFRRGEQENAEVDADQSEHDDRLGRGGDG